MICFITLNLLLLSLINLQGTISFMFEDISSLLRSSILKSSIYFDIGFKLNGKFFSTYDIFYYVKFTALSIKTICRALSLLVLKILAVY